MFGFWSSLGIMMEVEHCQEAPGIHLQVCDWDSLYQTLNACNMNSTVQRAQKFQEKAMKSSYGHKKLSLLKNQVWNLQTLIQSLPNSYHLEQLPQVFWRMAKQLAGQRNLVLKHFLSKFITCLTSIPRSHYLSSQKIPQVTAAYQSRTLLSDEFINLHSVPKILELFMSKSGQEIWWDPKIFSYLTKNQMNFCTLIKRKGKTYFLVDLTAKKSSSILNEISFEIWDTK